MCATTLGLSANGSRPPAPSSQPPACTTASRSRFNSRPSALGSALCRLLSALGPILLAPTPARQFVASPARPCAFKMPHGRANESPSSSTSQITRGGTSPRYEFRRRLFQVPPPLASAHAWTLGSKRAGEGGSYLKRVLRNSYLGLVPPRVICEVGDGGGWPTSRITRGGARPSFIRYMCLFSRCVCCMVSRVLCVFFIKIRYVWLRSWFIP